MSNGQIMPPSPTLSTQAPIGATIQNAYVEREMKVFGILESEVRMISMFNTLSTTFFSVTSALFSAALSIWVNKAFVEKTTPEGIILSEYVAPGLCVLAVVFLSLAIWARVSRGSTWTTICKESRQRSP